MVCLLVLQVPKACYNTAVKPTAAEPTPAPPRRRFRGRWWWLAGLGVLGLLVFRWLWQSGAFLPQLHPVTQISEGRLFDCSTSGVLMRKGKLFTITKEVAAYDWSGQLVATYTHPFITSACYSPSGKLIAILGKESRVYRVQVYQGRQLCWQATIPQKEMNSGSLHSLLLGEDGRVLIYPVDPSDHLPAAYLVQGHRIAGALSQVYMEMVDAYNSAPNRRGVPYQPVRLPGVYSPDKRYSLENIGYFPPHLIAKPIAGLEENVFKAPLGKTQYLLTNPSGARLARLTLPNYYIHGHRWECLTQPDGKTLLFNEWGLISPDEQYVWLNLDVDYWAIFHR